MPNSPAAVKGEAAAANYPEFAREQGATGTAQIEVTLSATGALAGLPTVYKSAGNAALDQSAIEAAKATAFLPAVVNCVKTGGPYIFVVDFTGS